MRNLFLLSVIVVLSQTAKAEKFTITKNSQVSYTVHAKTAFGLFKHTIIGRNNSVSGDFEVNDGIIRGKVNIPVSNFESGNTRRDNDVSIILKADEFPFIIAEIDSIDTTSIFRSSVDNPVTIPVFLTVAGIKRKVNMSISYMSLGDTLAQVNVKGKTKFTDFNISPPRIRGLGAIGKVITYAPDEVFLEGKIFVKPNQEKE